MKKILLAVVVVGMLGGRASAADRYWDINGATAGSSGGTTASGTWDLVTANWTLDSTGASATSTWVTTDTAVFSAGTNATGASVIAGTATASGLVIEEGAVEFTGTITLGASPITVNSGATLVTNSSARISTTAGSVYTLNGGTLRTTNAGAAGSFVDIDSTITLGAAGGTFDYQVLNVLNIVQGTTVISGSGDLTKTGGGVLAIASASTFTGDTIINGGELRMRSGTNRLPTTTDVTVNGTGILNLNGSGQNQTIASLSGDGRVGLAGGILTINGTTSTTFSGVIENVANAGAAGATTASGSVTKSGASQLTLTGANTFSTLLTISSQVGNSVSIGNGGTTGSVTSNIATTTNGAVIFNRSNDFSYDALISGAGTVTKAGAGIMTINGNDWTNTGGVIINGGAIKFGNSAAGLATTVPVTINNGGVLDMNAINDTFGSLVSSGANTTGELRMTTSNLTLGQTATTARTYNGTITGSGTLTKGGGTYTQTLSGDSSSYSGNIVVSLGTVSVGSANALGNTAGNTQVASDAAILFTGAATNFTINEAFEITGTGGSNNGAIAVSASATPTLSGPVSLAGDTTLTVAGTSAVTFSNANAITSLSNQNLTLAGGSGAGNGGTISGAVNLGTGSLTKNQSGTWKLSSPTGNTYSGGTIINSGTLQANNTSGSATGSGSVTVNGGTLAGTGIVTGAVTINSGGTLAPGTSIDSLEIGTLTFNDTGTDPTFGYEIDTSTAMADLLTVNGDLNIANGATVLAISDVTPSTNLAGTTFTLIAYTGTWNGGTFAGLPNNSYFSMGANDWLITYDAASGGSNFGGGVGNAYVTIFTAVPEASSFLAVGVAAVVAGGVTWLRRKRAA